MNQECRVCGNRIMHRTSSGWLTHNPDISNAIVQVTGSFSRALAGCLLFAGKLGCNRGQFIVSGCRVFRFLVLVCILCPSCKSKPDPTKAASQEDRKPAVPLLGLRSRVSRGTAVVVLL